MIEKIYQKNEILFCIIEKIKLELKLLENQKSMIIRNMDFDFDLDFSQVYNIYIITHNVKILDNPQLILEKS